MLDVLISNKTRVKLLIKFFLNPDQKGYLRGLEQEFEEGSNAIRVELNRFEEAGLLNAHTEGNKKIFEANRAYPLFNELRAIALKHFGIDHIIDSFAQRLGSLHAVYLTGALAEGRDSDIIDLTFIASDLDRDLFYHLLTKAEHITKRSIRTLVLNLAQVERLPEPNVLLYEA